MTILKNTGSKNFKPNLFIDEILRIIKNVFVKGQNLVSKLFKSGLAY